MSSLNWLKPSNKTQAKWFKQHMAKRHPGIDRKLTTNSLNDKSYCENFKKLAHRFWLDEYERKVKIQKLRNAWDKTQSRKNQETKNLSVDIPSTLKTQFSKLAKFHKVTQAELLADLIEVYNQDKGQSESFETATTRKGNAEKNEALNQEIESLKEQLTNKEELIKQLQDEVNTVNIHSKKEISPPKDNSTHAPNYEIFLKHMPDLPPQEKSHDK